MRARDNPLRVERLHALTFRFPPGDDLSALLTRLHSRRGRGAIIGKKGSGKSTLVEQLAARWRREGRDVRLLRVHAGRHRLCAADWSMLTSGLSANSAVIIDGAGHLWPGGFWRLRWRVRMAGIFLCTAHRRGLVPVLLRTATDVRLLDRLLDELGVRDPRSAERFAHSRGDLRRCLRSLYDEYADASEPTALPPSESARSVDQCLAGRPHAAHAEPHQQASMCFDPRTAGGLGRRIAQLGGELRERPFFDEPAHQERARPRIETV